MRTAERFSTLHSAIFMCSKDTHEDYLGNSGLTFVQQIFHLPYSNVSPNITQCYFYPCIDKAEKTMDCHIPQFHMVSVRARVNGVWTLVHKGKWFVGDKHGIAVT